MKKKISTLVLFLAIMLPGMTQAPLGLNYQGVARNASGQVLAEQNINLRLSLLQGSETGTLVWEESQAVTTNTVGLFNLVIGTDDHRTGGSAATFAEVDWSTPPYFLKVEMDAGQGFVDMGTSQLLSVPYALYGEDADADPGNELITDFDYSGTTLSLTDAGGTRTANLSALLDNTDSWEQAGDSIFFMHGNVGIGTDLMRSRLAVTGYGTDPEEPLFEVRRADGQTVFAVYNEGIRAYVDDSPVKGSKGGFAVGGFNPSKGVTNEYFRVTPDSVRVYIDETIAKGSKGGFAVGGFNPGKATPTDLMYLNKDNYFIGHESGMSTTGTYNTFFGYNAGLSNTSGSNNIFMGYRAGYSNLGANNNVFLGNEAGYNNTNGYSNIFMGIGSGYSNTTGYRNVFIGERSGHSNTDGIFNTFIGYLAGENNTSGDRNTFVGYRSGLSNTTGEWNAFFGFQAGYANTTGSYNSYFGQNTAFNTTESSYNSFMGYETGMNSQGSYNTYMGYQAGKSGTSDATGVQNVAIGYRAGTANTTGSYNVFIGPEAGYSNQDGNYNTFVGFQAGFSNVGGDGTWEGEYNTFLGYQAGYNSTSGHRNIAIGYRSGYGITTNRYNVMIGEEAGYSLASGQANVLIGTYAGEYLNGGSGNVMIGLDAGWYATTATDNVMIGLGAGRSSNGNGNVFLGRYAGYAENGSDKLVIENNYTGSDNENNALIYGDFSLNRLRINANTSINTAYSQYYGLSIGMDANDSYGLVVYGPTWCSSGAWAGSDINLKTNIRPFENPLEKITQINGVYYEWKPEFYESLGVSSGKQIGVIAQDVEKVLPELVHEGPDGYKSVDYSKLTAVLIEAIKEQQKQIEELQKEVELLKK